MTTPTTTPPPEPTPVLEQLQKEVRWLKRAAFILGLAGVGLLAVVAVLVVGKERTEETGRTDGKEQASVKKSGRRETLYKGKPTSGWIKQLKDKEAASRKAAILALHELGVEASACSAELAELLADPDHEVRRVAAETLGKMSPDNGSGEEKKPKQAAEPPAVAAEGGDETLYQGKPSGFWINQLHDKDPASRRAAVLALRELGREALVAVPDLAGLLKDSDQDVRRTAAETLGKMGPEARAAVPALVDRLQDEDKDVCLLATWALGKVGPEATAAVPALSQALKDHDDLVRESAAKALREIGPKAKSAVPALIEALDDRSRYVRDEAALALKTLDPEAAARARIR